MKIEYRLFGFVIWSVTRTLSVDDKEALYKEFSERFGRDMNEALNRARQTAQ